VEEQVPGPEALHRAQLGAGKHGILVGDDGQEQTDFEQIEEAGGEHDVELRSLPDQVPLGRVRVVRVHHDGVGQELCDERCAQLEMVQHRGVAHREDRRTRDVEVVGVGVDAAVSGVGVLTRRGDPA